ncbi:MAG: serine hydrolase domain-containing protein [Syntrophales bacterium]
MDRVSSTLRRFAVFILPLLVSGLFPGCSSDSAPPNYAATIAEAKAAVDEAIAKCNPSAITVAVVDDKRIIWIESREVTGKAMPPETMFGIGSVSKMFATIAVMQLVEKGSIELDEPLTTYLKEFSMISPEYRNITVRMLVNHSAGFPGGDLRNGLTGAPFTGFAAQVMEGLKYQRLKHAPGYLNVYSNDGFTMVENLVKARTGLSYPEYVRQEILTPLGMTNSRYPDDYLPEESYARPYTGDTPQPYTSLNLYATGSLYSSAADMGKLIMMLINGGVSGTTRILFPGSIAAMAEDQTRGTFNPAPTDMVRYGLGWDTVVQPGLKAVGVKGWQKGGTINGAYGTMYRSTMIVAPDAKLGVVAMMASNQSSSDMVAKVGEQVLLRALVDNGTIAEMPAMQPRNPLPVITPTSEEKSTCSSGFCFYASSSTLYRLKFAADGSLTVESYLGENTWTPTYASFKKRSDGWYAADGDSITALRFLTASGRNYIDFRKLYGAEHYTTTYLLAQQLDARGAISTAWQNRMATRWLPMNRELYLSSFLGLSIDNSLLLTSVDGLPGYLFTEANLVRDMEPPAADRLDGMYPQIPQVSGRDLTDAAVERREESDWLRVGSTLFRPLSGISSVPAGDTSVTIGSEGFVEWRKLPVSGSISIDNARAWRLYDSNFDQKASGAGSGSAVLPGSGEAAYLMLFGTPGATISLRY